MRKSVVSVILMALLFCNSGAQVINRLSDIAPSSGNSWPKNLVGFQGKLYFNATDGENDGLYIYNMDSVYLASFENSLFDSVYCEPAFVFNDKLFIRFTTDETGTELGVYDGVNPPYLLADLVDGELSSKPEDFIPFGGKLYFNAGDTWYYYNPESGSVHMADFEAGTRFYGISGNNPVVFKNNLFMTANGDGNTGLEVYKYDGLNYPEFLGHVAPDTESSWPSHYTVAKDKLFFWALNQQYGQEVWYTDGESAPELLSDIFPGPDYGGGQYPDGFGVLRDTLYFAAQDSTNCLEIWKYDGENAPQPAFKLFTGSRSEYPTDYNDFEFTTFQDKLFIKSIHTLYGTSSGWIYDGINPPQIIDDFYPNLRNIYFNSAVEYNNHLFFSAIETTSGRELYELSFPGNYSNRAQACGTYLSPDGVTIWDESGTYIDTLQAFDGGDSIIVTQLTIDMPFDAGVHVSDSVLSVDYLPNASFIWLNEQNNEVVGAGHVFRPEKTGAYYAVINRGACTDTTEVTNFEIPDALKLTGKNISKVYPNPTADKVTIQLATELGNGKYVVRNLLGEPLRQGVITNANQLTIDLPEPKGLYIIEIGSPEKGLQSVFVTKY